MEKQGLSVYVHIPFCKRKCLYCDFPSFAEGREVMEQYRDALIKEIREEEETGGRKVKTLYFGGGTPSFIPEEYIGDVIYELSRKYEIEEDAEITLEMNPGTASRKKLETYRELGINRISLGCQSFNDETLRRLGRIHGRDEIFETFEMLREEGFHNINLDLISSVPGEKKEELKKSLVEAVKLNPRHISVYSLILEEGTELYRQYKEGELQDLPNEEETEENDFLTETFLSEEGYHRYEISNYCREGFECRHNISYWKRDDYRGFGLGAASLIGDKRFTNVSDFSYLKDPGNLKSEDRILSTEEKMEEFMFLGLRLLSGVSDVDFKETFGQSIQEVYGDILNEQIKQGFMEREGMRFFYNSRGLRVSNVLMSRFLF